MLSKSLIDVLKIALRFLCYMEIKMWLTVVVSSVQTSK